MFRPLIEQSVFHFLIRRYHHARLLDAFAESVQCDLQQPVLSTLPIAMIEPWLCLSYFDYELIRLHHPH